jgi:hypothetical protein
MEIRNRQATRLSAPAPRGAGAEAHKHASLQRFERRPAKRSHNRRTLPPGPMGGRTARPVPGPR